MNQIKTLGLLSLLSALLVGIGYLIIGGTGGILIGIAMAAVMNLGSWYFSDKIALNAYRAQPISREQAPGLHAMLERLSQKAGIPTPALYVVPGQAANAFATGRDPQHAAVAVTEGIVNLLSEEELEGVIAHELSHVMNRDTLTQAVAATIAGAISQLAYMAQWASYGAAFGSSDYRRGGNPIGLLLAMFLAPLAASLIQMSLSRTREYEADAGAARLTGKPRALASALQKLEMGAQRVALQANPAFSPLLIINSVSGGGLRNLFATHPSTKERIERLLQMEQQFSKPAAA
jgi:heat shock protein HtpX